MKLFYTGYETSKTNQDGKKDREMERERERERERGRERERKQKKGKDIDAKDAGSRDYRRDSRGDERNVLDLVHSCVTKTF